MSKETRTSIIAGAWYAGSPAVLKSDIEEFMANVPSDPVDGPIVAIVSPHAGYVYSGQVAAYAYKQIQGRTFDTVIIIGPSHRSYFHGASVYNKGGYKTPLGIVPVNIELANTIIALSHAIYHNPDAHSQEHSVEIQLPFLQVILGDFNFVPIVMGSQDRQTCEEVVQAIFTAIQGKNVMIVASTDLSHFHGYDQAVSMDSIVLKHVEKMESEQLLQDLGNGTCEACGGGPMAAAIMLAKKLGADSSKVLKYANSGDVTGDRRGVVGYMSAVFYKRNQGHASDSGNKTGVELGLSAQDKDKLLEIARKSIECKLAGTDIPDFSFVSDMLKEKRGAFVTLKKQGMLRGCIGSFEPRGSLCETVEEVAQSAAFSDPRFPSVRAEELKDLTIEISALTPLRKIKNIDEIEVGKHGIYIVRGLYRGVLLPQVATDHKWDKITFLEETCHKAGLPSHAWKDKETDIYIFSADIFGEKE
ncbi:MAG: AmmeMemoRadiSam system protein B [Deltaproteobacteria bacterium]|nr:AmmeMemoRadiSam system protein B [Deltaproteobacteria bacterium]